MPPKKGDKKKVSSIKKSKIVIQSKNTSVGKNQNKLDNAMWGSGDTKRMISWWFNQDLIELNNIDLWQALLQHFRNDHVSFVG